MRWCVVSFAAALAMAVDPRGAVAQPVPVPETLVQHLERRIDVIQHREASVKAFIDTDLAAARRRAAELTELNGGGSVYGLVVAVKDNIGVAGFTTTAGSRTLAAIPKRGAAAADAPVVAALREQGAIVVGTTNMDTWARGVRGVSEVRGQTANPNDLTRNAGGSSAGSAAAVAAGMVDLAIGTDTCGSIRYPASSVGIYGLKPTWGAASLVGVVPLAPGQDVVGPLAADAGTLRKGWRALNGTGKDKPAVRNRIGVVTGMGALDPAWKRRARAAGFELIDVGPAPSASGVNLIEAQFPIAQRAYVRWRQDNGAQTWLNGEGTLGTPAQRAVQRSIQSKRRLLAQGLTDLLDDNDLDALAYPTNRALPAKLGAAQTSGNCMLASGSGLPALVVPGVVPAGERLAVGVDLLGRAGSEDVLLALADRL